MAGWEVHLLPPCLLEEEEEDEEEGEVEEGYG